MREDRFTWSGGDVLVSQCIYCKHSRPGRSCDAFEEVPLVILTNEHDHRNPYPGDNGILFESRTGEIKESYFRKL